MKDFSLFTLVNDFALRKQYNLVKQVEDLWWGLEVETN
jgi:hypothetical protein